MTKPAVMYACVHVTEFPAQAMLRLRGELRDRPCVVLDGDPPMQHVCSCNMKARILGIQRGMTRVEVDTFPSVTVLSRSRTEEVGAKAAMLQCAGTFSPAIEDRSNANAFLCVMDIAGTERLHGPPAMLGATLLDSTASIGIVSTIAIASNFHAAICLARGMRSKKRITFIPSGEEGAALSLLPLNVLDLSEEQAETFSRWGIYTLGMLAELPEKPLIARMGQEGKRLRQLAHGALPHLFVPIEPVFTLEECVELDSPVELLESLLFVVGAMLEQLIVRATSRVLALACVTITLSLEGGGSHNRTVRPSLPSNDRRLWIKLLHLDLEAHPASAAILSVRLTAEPGSTSKIQFGLFSPQLPEPTRLDVTLARIRAMVGEECVGSPVLKDCHRPDAFQMKPFAVPSRPATTPAANRSMAAVRQLRPAEEVMVTLREKRPVSIVFRRTQYDVERSYGPWLAGGEWWAHTRWGLQQWDLVARSQDGMLLCCCLVRDRTENAWLMAALYD
ncbi:MAG: DNA polymerase Y family protein [Acidobacteriaceae bacterium]